jgi:microcystin-dependent protein
MIIKNGKRLDGFCVDSLPIGTLQPYLGLKAPNGYLICDGSLISKAIYPELYIICGSLFGAETSTHFYLPDLRGKTIAGYNADDTTLNTIGKLLGAISHTHTSAAHTHTVAGHTHTSAAHTHTSAAHTHSTGNHTLTVAEMPSHGHTFTRPAILGVEDQNDGSYYSAYNYRTSSAYSQGTNNTGGGGAHNHGNTGSTTPGKTGSTTPGATGSTSLTTNSTTPGATGSSSNYQPTMVANWIVKAKNLVPVTGVVENRLDSTSEVNALSAAQGKILNEKFDNYLTHNNLDIVVNNLTIQGSTRMYGWQNMLLTATQNNQDWSFDLNNGSEDKTGCFFQFWSSTNQKPIMELYNDNNEVYIRNGNLHLESGYAYLNAQNNGEAFFEVLNKETGHGARLGVGSGKVNHGVWSNHHNKWMVYGDANGIYLNGNANSATVPLGFNARGNGTWGNQTGNLITDWQDFNGGDIQFRQDNPSAGKMSALIDGYWYQREGVYRCIDASEYSSSRESKTNIKPTTHTNALEEIDKIEIVDFNFKDEERKDEPKIGFIADDTDSIFSGLNKDKMDVYNCIGMLLKAVQELNDKIKKLENQAEVK